MREWFETENKINFHSDYEILFRSWLDGIVRLLFKKYTWRTKQAKISLSFFLCHCLSLSLSLSLSLCLSTHREKDFSNANAIKLKMHRFKTRSLPTISIYVYGSVLQLVKLIGLFFPDFIFITVLIWTRVPKLRFAEP